MAVQDYNHPYPELPDDPGVNEDTKFILDLYSQEIRDHAGSTIYIQGMSPQMAQRYKHRCYEAARFLTDAADILRRHYMSKAKPNKHGK